MHHVYIFSFTMTASGGPADYLFQGSLHNELAPSACLLVPNLRSPPGEIQNHFLPPAGHGGQRD